MTRLFGYLTAVLLVLAPAHDADAGEGRVRVDAGAKPRFVKSFGWGGMMNIYAGGYNLIITQDKFLAENRVRQFDAKFSGSLSLAAGIGAGRAEVLAFTGFRVCPIGSAQIPAGIRSLVFVGKKKKYGTFIMLEESMGIAVRDNEKPSFASAIGAGDRIRLTDGLSLSCQASFSYCFARPSRIKDPYSGLMIENENIRKAYLNLFGLAFGMSLYF